MTVRNQLNSIAPPRLPTATDEYERYLQDQMLNILRLYFNQINSTINSVIGTNGGQYVDCPNALFFNTADQTFAVANTAYAVVYNQTYLNNAVALQSGSTSKIEVTVSGIYNFQYSGQLESTNSSAKNFFLWISRDGTDIGYSTRAYSISGSGTYAPISFSFDIDLQAGQYIELMSSASDTSLNLGASTASSPHPGIPSSVMTVNFVAPLPAVLPTPPSP
jgi:hypothetical protein